MRESVTDRGISGSFSVSLLVGNFVTAERLGKVYAAPFDVRLSEQDVVQPDLIFVSRSRLSIIGEHLYRRAPDLLVEILSPSTRDRDRREKARLYAMSGVPEYWLVDPDARTVTVLSLKRGTYQPLMEEHGVVRSAVLRASRSIRPRYSPPSRTRDNGAPQRTVLLQMGAWAGRVCPRLRPQSSLALLSPLTVTMGRRVWTTSTRSVWRPARW